MSNFTTTVTLDGISVYVEGTFTKGDPGRWTLANGDPGYPPSGDEVDFKWSRQSDDDYDTLIADYGSEMNVYEAINDIILDNPDRYVA